jgi:hypothetical protein
MYFVEEEINMENSVLEYDITYLSDICGLINEVAS